MEIGKLTSFVVTSQTFVSIILVYHILGLKTTDNHGNNHDNQGVYSPFSSLNGLARKKQASLLKVLS